MKHQLIRAAVTAATVLGVVAAGNLMAAASAPAVQSEYNCLIVQGPTNGVASGTNCSGYKSGTGWLNVANGDGTYREVARCYLTPSPDGNTIDVSGTSCVPSGSSPPEVLMKTLPSHTPLTVG